MTNREWTNFIGGLLDAIEGGMHTDAPSEDREALQTMRNRLAKKRVTEARQPYVREIDRLIENRPYLLASALKHIGKIAPPAIEQAAATLKQARDLLARAPNHALRRTGIGVPVFPASHA